MYRCGLIRIACVFLFFWVSASKGSTYYDHYVPDGVRDSGLVASGTTFTLNGKDIHIFSGAFHYFRIHPDYWRQTFKKLRAAGLNTVETYMPWNLHNPRHGTFDYGTLGEEMSPFLNVRAFVQMAKEEDLFVILRPGPYICSEWDLGGLPSWLLREPNLQVRTYDDDYRQYADAYLATVGYELSGLTFMKGGPIIAVQIENEYGAFGYEDHPRDHLYMKFLKERLDEYGFGDTLYFTSDSPANTHDWGAIPGVLQTANFKENAEENLDRLKQLQPNRPLMVMEFWTGWFDHWVVEDHNGWDPKIFNETLDKIFQYNSSVNLYMFIGGTNFGFMAGANIDPGFPGYKPDVSSYDYDALLTEAGDYTEKYDLAQQLIAKYNPLEGIVVHPERPEENNKTAYGEFAVDNSMDFEGLVGHILTNVSLEDGPVNMEALDINHGNGQSYGYTLYTATVDPKGATECELLIRGHVRDMAQVFVDGVVKTDKILTPNDLRNNFGSWFLRDAKLNFTCSGEPFELSILVENLGRVNYGEPHYYVQKKGLWEGPILVNGEIIKKFTARPLEFRKDFIDILTNWQPFSNHTTPSLYKSTIHIDTPTDTFLDMSQWGKGVAFLNGFNLGRYWSAGPTHTVYIPGPLLKEGDNEIMVFEQYSPADIFTFIDYPKL